MELVNTLSLFSGIGGFEAGMSNLGFTFKEEIEFDEKCCQTLNVNAKLLGIGKNVIPMDITQIEPSSLDIPSIDCIVGGPPCQSFSAAGRRFGKAAGTRDARGRLFERYCAFLGHFKPKAFVFENVKGILSTNDGKDFESIMNALADEGYDLFWSMLNAASFGVPQFRERVFIVGTRNDLQVDFKFPKATHGKGLLPYVNAEDALKCVPAPAVPEQIGGRYGHLIDEIPPGQNYSHYTSHMGHPNPVFGWRTRFSSFLYKMNPKSPCRTLTASPGKYDGPIHWTGRKCTKDELKMLQGFPMEYSIPFDGKDAVHQIGNSVCPPVAKSIGQALLAQVYGISQIILLEGSVRKWNVACKGIDCF